MKLLEKFFGDAPKAKAIGWSFFDFANSSYSLLISTFVFAIYFKEVIAGAELGDFYWGLTVSISILLGGLLAPLVGAVADHTQRRKNKFVTVTILAIIGTAALYFTGRGELLLASIIFIITNIFFELAQTLYDSFLPRVSTPATAGRISGLAWGFGYLGGISAMLLLRPFYGMGYTGALEPWYKLTFPLTALFFLVFSLPVFLTLKEAPSFFPRQSIFQLTKIGFRRIAGTIRNIREHKTIAWFLLAFYLMNDGLVTLFAFTPIYGRTTFNLTFEEITPLILFIQLIGFPAATFFGWLSDRRGSRKILLATIAIWTIILILMATVRTKTLFYFIALLAGLVIGSSQAIARSWLSRLVPQGHQAEFFGFNGFASKVAATTGPALFGTVSALTGSQRLAMAALLPFFVLAFIIFARIKKESLES